MCVPREDQERSGWRHGSHDPVETGKFVYYHLRDLTRSHNHPALQIFQSVHVVGDLTRPQEHP